MRERRHPNENYYAIFNNGITLRFPIDASLPILPLRYPEIEDISLGTRCLANCSYCYTSAIKNGENYPDVLGKIRAHYGALSLNERPFQVALGGGGEPTMHPDFIAVLALFDELQIMPNYTTNGMHLNDDILAATQKYSGGVAVSCHPHIEKVWRRAVVRYVEAGIKTHVHIIVGEAGSSDMFWRIYDSTEGLHNYVVLPYMAVGRGKAVEVEGEWDIFFKEACDRKVTNLAFGAHFYEYFLRNLALMREIGVSVYEPEVLSGYRLLDDSFNLLRKSSYDLSPKFAEVM